MGGPITSFHRIIGTPIAHLLLLNDIEGGAREADQNLENSNVNILLGYRIRNGGVREREGHWTGENVLRCRIKKILKINRFDCRMMVDDVVWCC